jgi:hypothetical protein
LANSTFRSFFFTNPAMDKSSARGDVSDINAEPLTIT